MFRNNGPEYFGDNDEGDEALLAEEEEAARLGVWCIPARTIANLV
jgi:hypothetical protein